MAERLVEPWGRYPKARQQVRPLRFSSDALPPAPPKGLLAHGMGRSYGDVCLNEGGLLLRTTGMDRVLAFDRMTGVVRCEAGTTLDRLLDLLVPHGWFPPVVPGTRHVTVGGAVANDIHGKNHHVAGTFGRHVRAFGLARTDGPPRRCTPEDALFGATVGGLGLTGLLTWVEFQARRVPGPWVDAETLPMRDLDDFFRLSKESEGHEHTVAWVDTTSRRVGKGVFFRGDHAEGPPKALDRSSLRYPLDGPGWLLNRATVHAFNAMYGRLQRLRAGKRRVHYAPFFFPLDGIEGWNTMYGPAGFFQYQFVVPHAGAHEAVHAVFSELAGSPEKSFLSVLKVFGGLPSPGLLSFPRPGVTLALDFRNRGAATLGLLERLDAIVADHGGRVYPAKDARMSPEGFQRFFPEWKKCARHFDPGFSSDFWRRTGSALRSGGGASPCAEAPSRPGKATLRSTASHRTKEAA